VRNRSGEKNDKRIDNNNAFKIHKKIGPKNRRRHGQLLIRIEIR
jgi:hypothetical protein